MKTSPSTADVMPRGPDVLRDARLAALKAMGLCPPDVVPHPVIPEGAKEWAEMTPEEQAISGADDGGLCRDGPSGWTGISAG